MEKISGIMVSSLQKWQTKACMNNSIFICGADFIIIFAMNNYYLDNFFVCPYLCQSYSKYFTTFLWNVILIDSTFILMSPVESKIGLNRTQTKACIEWPNFHLWCWFYYHFCSEQIIILDHVFVCPYLSQSDYKYFTTFL